MAGGRPTIYRPSFCRMLLDHMKKGHSYDTFPALLYEKKELNTVPSRSTIYEWEKKFEEFSDAKKQARVLCKFYWEKLLIKITKSKFGKSYAQSIIIFTMKNMFGWRDSPLDISEMPDEQLIELVRLAQDLIEDRRGRGEERKDGAS